MEKNGSINESEIDPRKVTITVTGYPWDYTLILKAMHSALSTLRDVGGIGTYDEVVIRTAEERLRIGKAIDLLGKISSDEFSRHDEEDKSFDELMNILREDLRGWWN